MASQLLMAARVGIAATILAALALAGCGGGGSGGGKSISPASTTSAALNGDADLIVAAADLFYLIDPNGGKVVQVPGTEHLVSPSWSPDGKLLTGSDLQNCCDVYVFKPDGTEKRKLPFDSDTGLAWSPRGDRVALFEERDRSIHLVSLQNGKGPPLVEGNEASWSPDGDKIAFQWRAGGEQLRIFVIDTSGQNKHQLTAEGGTEGDMDPVWSPDGSQIAFASDRDGDYEIEVMKADGSGRQALTHNQVMDWYPTWSPDGTRLAFARGDFDQNTILVINADGSGEQRIAEGSGVTGLVWRPAPD